MRNHDRRHNTSWRSLTAMTNQIPEILKRVEEAGYAIFLGGFYNLNIIGLRSENLQAGDFADTLAVAYRDEHGWVARYFKITTDPGVGFLETPINPNGTAILCPGQYRSCYSIGRHRGQYEALVQNNGPVRVWRDADKDDTIDILPDTEVEGYFGINIHRATSHTIAVSNNLASAGCQVFADPNEFDYFMSLCESQVVHNPTWTKFTYTLLAS